MLLNKEAKRIFISGVNYFKNSIQDKDEYAWNGGFS